MQKNFRVNEMVNFGSALSAPYLLTKDGLERWEGNDQRFHILPLISSVIEKIHNIGTY